MSEPTCPLSIPSQSRKLPPEVWKDVIQQSILEGTDLKQVRLVCSSFCELATPCLFHHVTISLIPENLIALRRLTASSHLARQVRTIKIDNTIWNTSLNPRTYSQLAQKYFEQYLGTQNEGPFAARNLHQLLFTMPDTMLSNNFLTGLLRKDFVHGYSLYLGRSEYRRAFESGPALPHILTQIITPLVNVKSVKLYNDWEYGWLKEDERKQAFKNYLTKSLDPATLSQIGGLDYQATSSESETPSTDFSFFIAPGVAARRLNPLWLPPEYPTRGYSFIPDALTTNIFGVLPSTLKIESLHLPADACMGRDTYNIETTEHKQYIHPSILVGRPEMQRRAPDNFLVSAFANIKELHLKLDCIVYSRVPDIIISYNATAITIGIQALRQVRELRVAFRADQATDRIAGQEIFVQMWSIGRLFLTGLEIEGIEEDTSDGDSADHDMNQITQGLDAIVDTMGITHWVSAGQPASANGGNTMLAPFHVGPQPYGVLRNNPWPQLRILSLANMMTTFGDLHVLLKTIAPSLRELTLWQIRLIGSCKSCTKNRRMREHHTGDNYCVDWIDIAITMKDILTL